MKNIKIVAIDGVIQFSVEEFESVFEDIRANAYEEASDEIDRLATFYAGDKDGNPITPKMLKKDDVMKVLKQLGEKK